jgi:hypothetical protein
MDIDSICKIRLAFVFSSINRRVHVLDGTGGTASKLLCQQLEGPMSERFCSLIILGPGSPRTFKLHLSRGAIVILLIAFLLSFLTVVVMGYTFPITVNDSHRKTLEAENDQLRLDTAYAAAGIETLNAKMAELEETSKRIDGLMQQ